ncbi:hypothetical protein KSZ_05620 [Dictyobacter formicarum]|uniref:Transposase n=1 Tax=Dictyobacter formicarum TaxID=2778368 RepID=A0ABQ3VAP8_9CHLR|nr:hypothetical protein KSZ_05620 [Dictyobacter formicarum]
MDRDENAARNILKEAMDDGTAGQAGTNVRKTLLDTWPLPPGCKTMGQAGWMKEEFSYNLSRECQTARSTSI